MKKIFLSLVIFLLGSASVIAQSHSLSAKDGNESPINTSAALSVSGIEGIGVMVAVLVLAVSLLTARKVREAMFYDL